MSVDNNIDNAAQTEKEMTLLELLDRLLDKGIVIYGDLVISIADIDLIYLGVRLVLGSVDKLVECCRKENEIEL